MPKIKETPTFSRQARITLSFIPPLFFPSRTFSKSPISPQFLCFIRRFFFLTISSLLLSCHSCSLPFFLFCVLHHFLLSFFICFSLYKFPFFLLSLFLYHLLPFFSHIYFVSSLIFFHASLPLFRILRHYFLFSFILNYKVVSVFYYLLRFYHTLILFVLTLYFPLLSSCFYPHFFHAFYTLFLRSFLPFFCYSMLTFLCPPSQFHLCRCIRVYTGKSFCSRIEMTCNYEARGKYHLSRDAISSWLIVIAFSCYSRDGLTSWPRIDFTRDFVVCPDNPSDTAIHKKPKAPAGR